VILRFCGCAPALAAEPDPVHAAYNPAMTSPRPRSQGSPAGESSAPGATRGRTSSSRRELITGEILEHATRLFAERGYDGTTLQDIAEAIGITRPGLYNYIKSKEELLAALVTDVTENTARIVRTVRLRSDLTSVEKLRALVRSLVLQRATAPERFRVLDRTEAVLPPEVASAHQQAKRAVLTEVRTIIEEGVSRGEFRPRDERIAALSVIGMCNWVAWWFHPSAGHPAEPVADQLAQNAVDMLAYPGADAGPIAPHRALQAVRENLDYLERFLGPAGHDDERANSGPS
jgi:AcrR family transcriptional regulator